MDKRVLIVDDDSYVRLAVSEVLKDAGINVVEAANAGECMAVLRAGFRGVVLMDIMMPVKDGWDVIRDIVDHGLFKDIIVIMLTALDAPGEKMNGLQEYVADYITKPFESERLVGDVRDYFKYLDRM